MSITDDIRKRLHELEDRDYGDFSARIIPNVPRERIIGVRSPKLKKLVSEYRDADMSGFLAELPHRYAEENYIHAQLINRIRDYDSCIAAVEAFLPYIDNWAACDSLTPKALAKNRPALLQKVREWHGSGHTYTVRFGTGCLMRYFLGADFKPEYAEMAAAVRSEEYYINMMTAWYFATALAKNYDEVLPFIEQRRLDPWTHNKAIQKAIESYRVTKEHKDYLRTLKTVTSRTSAVSPFSASL